MAGWNELPKELKWMIFKYLVYECYGHGYFGKNNSLIAYKFMKRWSCESMITHFVVNPQHLCMYELFVLLSQIDKNR